MPQIEIKVFGTEDLIAKIMKLKGFTASPGFQALMHEAGDAYVMLAMRDVPKQSRLLKKSIGYTVTGGAQNPTLTVGVGNNDVKYASYVEYGTNPSVRTARMKRFMHWFQDGSGKTIQIPTGLKGVPQGAMSVFARSVNHPGTPPRPFFFKHFPVIRARFMLELQRLLEAELNSGPKA